MQKLHIQQIPLFAAIIDELTRQAKEQGITLYCVPRQMNAVIRCANKIIAEFGREVVSATPGMGIDAWLASDDTGASSKAMLVRLFGVSDGNPADYPHDPADFGRCYRFLRAVPGARERLHEMADVSPAWAALVTSWSRLEALHEAKDPSLYDEIQKLTK